MEINNLIDLNSFRSAPQISKIQMKKLLEELEEYFLNSNFHDESKLYISLTNDEFKTLGLDFKVEFSKIIYQLKGGLRSSMGYIGARNLNQISKNAQFIKITKAGFYESMVHNVDIVKNDGKY